MEERTSINSQKTPQEGIPSQNVPTPIKYHHKNTKWLIVILLVVIILLFTGGIFAYFNITRSSVVEPITDNQQPITDISPTTDVSDVDSWQTYRNDEYGFEFKYPTLNKFEPQRAMGDNFEIFCYLLNKSATPKSAEGTACIWAGYITQATLNVSGITYCEAYYLTDTKRCEVVKTDNDNRFIIDWELDASNTDQKQAIAEISHPIGGKVLLYVQPVTNESKELFLKILSTFRFIN